MNMTRKQLMDEIDEARVDCAKYALAYPALTAEGRHLMAARGQLRRAKLDLAAAEKAWAERIAPAKGWAPDPLKDES